MQENCTKCTTVRVHIVILNLFIHLIYGTVLIHEFMLQET